MSALESSIGDRRTVEPTGAECGTRTRIHCSHRLPIRTVSGRYATGLTASARRDAVFSPAAPVMNGVWSRAPPPGGTKEKVLSS